MVNPMAVPVPEVDDAQVQAVFVPNDAPPALIAEAGYAFDEYVMRGLFIWGRKTAIHHMLGLEPGDTSDPKSHKDRQLARRLGWNDLPSGSQPSFAQRVAEFAKKDEDELRDWFEAYAKL